jgi:hypothetical protein
VLGEVRLNQHLPVDEDTTTPKLDGFTWQSYDALDRVILLTVVEEDNIPSLQ